ncbi:MAG TPA: hypothetical protein VNE82_07705 [Candidatus Binataceae bacterium]|nr:hypothetical protein [Candidatus Binataceae bacterium]
MAAALSTLAPVAAQRNLDAILSPLKVLHRHDGYISFHAGPNLRLIGALRPHELDDMFPALLEQLTRDAYYSINGLRGKWRNAKLVGHINACWVDVDYHDAADPQQAVRMGLLNIHAMIAYGVLPQPSMIVNSGRGFWLFWCLCDDSAPGRSLPAAPNSRALWIRLGRKIAGIAHSAGLPVDDAAYSIERLTRLPESINSKSGTRVAYTINFDHDGRPIEYSMRELAHRLNVPETLSAFVPPPLAVPSRQVAPAYADRKSSRQSSGWRALHEQRLSDLETLMELRGGWFREGCRNYATILFHIFTFSGPDHAARVSQFARERCWPSLEPAEIRGALKFKHRRIRDYKIGLWLGITPEEAQHLKGGEQYLAPMIHASTRAAAAKLRRESIQEMCRVAVPTLKQIAERLCRETGSRPSLMTIRADLRLLGVLNPRRHHQQTPNLPLVILPPKSRGGRETHICLKL